MSIVDDALKYHSTFPAGKLGIRLTKPLETRDDLTLAYTPGVGGVCEYIAKNAGSEYLYTNKGNLVAVISNGTSVLGLGNIGAIASKPVMEGKAMLFKKLAGVDAFDIEINEPDPIKLVQIISSLEPTFGGINLEDIKAPECFYIEQELKKQLSIPVMHDDQHGTAVVVCAALVNALEIAAKNIGEVRVVINGAGSGAIACAKLMVTLGVNKHNIMLFDSKGLVSNEREDLHDSKKEFAINSALTLSKALEGADVFLGLSKADILTVEHIQAMDNNPIVFALANPNPEIAYHLAINSRKDIIFSTGRSDYPNQVNNTLCFPFIFRGALDVCSTEINDSMKIAAVKAIANIAHEEPEPKVKKLFGHNLTFGRGYILPSTVDSRLFTRVSVEVAKAAVDTGVARNIITDWDKYRDDILKKL